MTIETAATNLLMKLGVVFGEWDNPDRLMPSEPSMRAVREAARELVAALGGPARAAATDHRLFFNDEEADAMMQTVLLNVYEEHCRNYPGSTRGDFNELSASSKVHLFREYNARMREATEGRGVFQPAIEQWAELRLAEGRDLLAPGPSASI